MRVEAMFQGGGGGMVCTQDQYGIDKSWVLLQPRAEPPVDLTDE